MIAIASVLSLLGSKATKYVAGGAAILLIGFAVYTYISNTTREIESLAAKNAVIEIQLQQSQDNFKTLSENFELQKKVINNLFADIADAEANSRLMLDQLNDLENTINATLNTTPGTEENSKAIENLQNKINQTQKDVNECIQSSASGNKPSKENSLCK